ncbi:MAG: hypothetical protein IM574_10800 [Cytophagales bacterium]|jgi:hypothetical protein|nr:hypothetical protein [Cytophagales bacterium]MCA6387522.1 hypothetical protein [Cytophagales bacterium]MCA6391193.1 hypothetical protein [Cytophagales bacterium]MCA6395831.1 hypothetical protein [Cytophagales bacterium]MCA6397662.1 hypothetical protein [Cytophagales bacterium]
METLELAAIKPELVYKLLNLGIDRSSLPRSIYRYLQSTPRDRPVSLEMTQILTTLLNLDVVFLKSKASTGEFEPIAIVYEKSRLDPVWNFIYLDGLISDWMAYASSIPKNLTSIYFELSIPHRVDGKEFFESDASSAFKTLRKYPGWNRVVKEGKFYTCFRRANEKLTVTIFCIAVYSPETNYGVLKRYINYAWKKATRLGFKLQDTTKSMQVKPLSSSVLPIQREGEYLKAKGEWDVGLIEKFIKKNCLAIPKVHDFGGSLKIQNC